MKRTLAAWVLLAVVVFSQIGWETSCTAFHMEVSQQVLTEQPEAFFPGLSQLQTFEKGPFAGENGALCYPPVHYLRNGLEAARHTVGPAIHDQNTHWKADMVYLLCPAHEFT